MLRIFYFIFLSLLVTACVKPEPENVQAMREISKLEHAYQCDKAKAIARQKLTGGELLFGLGSISYNCEKNEEKGIGYLKQAADQGYVPALKRLVSMGIATERQLADYQVLTDEKRKQAAQRKARKIELNNSLINMGGCGSLSCMARATNGTQQNTTAQRSAQNHPIRKAFYAGSRRNSRGQTMCTYADGSTVNNGYNAVCPMSINTDG